MSKRKEKFITELHTIMLERDISESKIKNLSSLKIEITKFSGYNSKINTHTFKTKFQVVEHTVPKSTGLNI